MDISALIDRYCEVWSEPDAMRRARLLDSLWAPHASYTDPSVHAANGDELLSHISKVQARRPGARVLRASQVDEHHRIARFVWHVVQADGALLLEGIDIALLSSDGKMIERVVGFVGTEMQAR